MESNIEYEPEGAMVVLKGSKDTNYSSFSLNKRDERHLYITDNGKFYYIDLIKYNGTSLVLFSKLDIFSVI